MGLREQFIAEEKFKKFKEVIGKVFIALDMDPLDAVIFTYAINENIHKTVKSKALKTKAPLQDIFETHQVVMHNVYSGDDKKEVNYFG